MAGGLYPFGAVPSEMISQLREVQNLREKIFKENNPDEVLPYELLKAKCFTLKCLNNFMVRERKIYPKKIPEFLYSFNDNYDDLLKHANDQIKDILEKSNEAVKSPEDKYERRLSVFKKGPKIVYGDEVIFEKKDSDSQQYIIDLCVKLHDELLAYEEEEEEMIESSDKLTVTPRNINKSYSEVVLNQNIEVIDLCDSESMENASSEIGEIHSQEVIEGNDPEMLGVNDIEGMEENDLSDSYSSNPRSELKISEDVSKNIDRLTVTPRNINKSYSEVVLNQNIEVIDLCDSESMENASSEIGEIHSQEIIEGNDLEVEGVNDIEGIAKNDLSDTYSSNPNSELKISEDVSKNIDRLTESLANGDRLEYIDESELRPEPIFHTSSVEGISRWSSTSTIPNIPQEKYTEKEFNQESDVVDQGHYNTSQSFLDTPSSDNDSDLIVNANKPLKQLSIEIPQPSILLDGIYDHSFALKNDKAIKNNYCCPRKELSDGLLMINNNSRSSFSGSGDDSVDNDNSWPDISGSAEGYFEERPSQKSITLNTKPIPTERGSEKSSSNNDVYEDTSSSSIMCLSKDTSESDPSLLNSTYSDKSLLPQKNCVSLDKNERFSKGKQSCGARNSAIVSKSTESGGKMPSLVKNAVKHKRSSANVLKTKKGENDSFKKSSKFSFRKQRNQNNMAPLRRSARLKLCVQKSTCVAMSMRSMRVTAFKPKKSKPRGNKEAMKSKLTMPKKIMPPVNNIETSDYENMEMVCVHVHIDRLNIDELSKTSQNDQKDKYAPQPKRAKSECIAAYQKKNSKDKNLNK